jgi:hypothetical protein
VNIWVRPWSELLAEAKWRYDFFRKRLEYEATTEDAMGYLREKYSQYFPDADSPEIEGNGKAEVTKQTKKQPAKKKPKRA